MAKSQIDLTNERVRNYAFLKDMYSDAYFPAKLVDKSKTILVNLCFQIEDKRPASLEGLYGLTHAATDKFNDLQDEFYENESEIETVARECIAEDFRFIATAYGFEAADTEELIATRDW